MALVAIEHELTGAAGADKSGTAISTGGATHFTLYVRVPGTWDRAGDVYVDASHNGTDWTPLNSGTASPLTQAVLATDDGKLFFVAKADEVHRYLRLRWNNTTVGTVGTLTMVLVIGGAAMQGWISTSS